MKLETNNKFIVAAFYAALAFFSIVIIYFFNHGLDLSDESYYFLRTLYYKETFASLSSFGRFNSILLSIAPGIFSFKLIGWIVLIIVSLFLTKEVSKKFNITDKLFIPILLVAIQFYYAYTWLPTPSYNWLNLIGVCCVTLGLLKISNTNFSKASLILLSLGGFLTFIAKPTTTVALAVCSIIFLLNESIKGKKLIKLTLILTGIFSVFFLIYSFLFFSSPMEHIGFLRKGLKISGLLESPHGPLVSVKKIILDYLKILKIFIPSILAYFILIKFVKRKMEWPKFVDIIVVLALFLIQFKLWKIKWMFGYFLFGYLNISAINLINGGKRLNSKRFITHILFILMSIGFVFGTSNNTFTQSLSVSFFLICIIWDHLNHFEDKKLKILFSVLVCILFSNKLYKTVRKPYRLGNYLTKQNLKVTFENKKSFSINVDEQTKKYIDTVKELVGKLPFKPVCVLDLTGVTPGINLVAGTKFCRSPWILGGYKGSLNYAKFFIEKITPEEKSKMLILRHDKTKSTIPIEALGETEESFRKKYKKLGSVYYPYRKKNQTLWVLKKSL